MFSFDIHTLRNWVNVLSPGDFFTALCVKASGKKSFTRNCQLYHNRHKGGVDEVGTGRRSCDSIYAPLLVFSAATVWLSPTGRHHFPDYFYYLLHFNIHSALHKTAVAGGRKAAIIAQQNTEIILYHRHLLSERLGRLLIVKKDIQSPSLEVEEILISVGQRANQLAVTGAPHSEGWRQSSKFQHYLVQLL